MLMMYTTSTSFRSCSDTDPANTEAIAQLAKDLTQSPFNCSKSALHQYIYSQISNKQATTLSSLLAAQQTIARQHELAQITTATDPAITTFLTAVSPAPESSSSSEHSIVTSITPVAQTTISSAPQTPNGTAPAKQRNQYPTLSMEQLKAAKASTASHRWRVTFYNYQLNEKNILKTESVDFLSYDFGPLGPVDNVTDFFFMEAEGDFRFDGDSKAFAIWARADDHVRVWIDDKLLIDIWEVRILHSSLPSHSKNSWPADVILSLMILFHQQTKHC
jgi:hypothetical protein